MLPDIAYEQGKERENGDETEGLYDDDTVKAALEVGVGRNPEGNACAVIIVAHKTELMGKSVAEVWDGLIFPDDVRDYVFPTLFDRFKTEISIAIGGVDEQGVDGEHLQPV